MKASDPRSLAAPRVGRPRPAPVRRPPSGRRVRRALAGALRAGIWLAPLLLLGAVGARQGPSPVGNPPAVRPIAWDDVADVRDRLAARGITAAAFASFVAQLDADHARRVRDGDFEHLVHYLLQSTRFTRLPAIEPALSAKALVDGLDPAARERFLAAPGEASPEIPAPVAARLAALLGAVEAPGSDVRLAYFRDLIGTAGPGRAEREALLRREYTRVMRFVYEKEFVAPRSAQGTAAVADLYRARGLSTDTAVEAGYLVHLGLGVVAGLGPARQVRRVLIVGPGLDLAPRTGLLEEGPPESYQPWAVIDALVSLGLSRTDDLQVVAADINPRVVEHLRRSRARPPLLTLVSGIRDTASVTLTREYRGYFEGLGRGVGEVRPAEARAGHLRKRVQVTAAAARALEAVRLDIVTERLTGPPFDLVVATNILPYFDDGELMLALCNVRDMLAPGGVFLHNEPRESLLDLARAVRLTFQQSRHAVIATVRGAPAPLFDSVFLHRREAAPPAAGGRDP